MPPQAYAIVTLFAACSLVLGILAQRLVAARAGGPRCWRWTTLPIGAAFAAFYLIGHRLGLSVGPEIGLFGFQIALFGDVVLGFAGALVVAFAQAVVVRSLRRDGSAAAAN